MTTTAVRLLSEIAGLRARMLTMCAPAAVACPRCGATPGHECRSATGNRPLAYHTPRRRLIAELDSDDARLRLLLEVYEQLANDAPKGSIWAGRAEVLRQLLDISGDKR